MSNYLIPTLLVLSLTACDSGKPAPKPAAPAAESVKADLVTGERVFKMTCSACHGSGAGGAPRMGMKAQWETRVSEGRDVLYQHALAGFTGAHGTMPPRGGNPSLSDDEVKAGVEYMLSKLPPT